MPDDSNWKTPVASPRASISYVLLSSIGSVVDVEVADQLDRLVDHVEVAQAEEVHLQQAELARRRPSRTASRPPGRRPSAGAARRSISGSAPITTPAAWIESARVSPSSGRARSTISFATGSESTALRSSAPGLRHSSSVWPGPFRDQLRDLVDDAVRDLEHAAGVADGGAGGHRREGDDLRDAVAAVLLGHVVDHALAAGDGEVDVHVGHLLAAGIEEALEEQVVADRVEVGDLEAVGDEAAGGRAAAGADADAVAASRSG